MTSGRRTWISWRDRLLLHPSREPVHPQAHAGSGRPHHIHTAARGSAIRQETDGAFLATGEFIVGHDKADLQGFREFTLWLPIDAIGALAQMDMEPRLGTLMDSPVAGTTEIRQKGPQRIAVLG